MYTVKQLKDLENSKPDHLLILEYRESSGYKFKGPMVSAYTSKLGKECVSIDGFTRTIPVQRVIGHSFEVRQNA